jgi:GTP pyrophosphokinase
MEDSATRELARLTLAPYIQKATVLIGHRRRVGGNQFRHAMATLAILIDYKFTDPVLLKASVIHDLFEDDPDTDRGAIAALDDDGPAVVTLVAEVSRGAEPKDVYLERIRHRGSRKARILKAADRISNLTDLHNTVFDEDFVRHYLDETERSVLPMALDVDPNMAREISDLVAVRRARLPGMMPRP